LICKEEQINDQRVVFASHAVTFPRVESGDDADEYSVAVFPREVKRRIALTRRLLDAKDIFSINGLQPEGSLMPENYNLRGNYQIIWSHIHNAQLGNNFLGNMSEGGLT
jgi:hypothetical protein